MSARSFEHNDPVTKVLIAPWGRPTWAETTYTILTSDKSGEASKISYKSKTSLHPLENYIKPDLTIVLCLDSLAMYEYKSSTSDCNNPSYKAIKEAAKDYVCKCIREFDEYYNKANNKSNNRPSRIIWVLPGTGNFVDGNYPSVQLKGSMMDFYYILLLKLSKFFVEHNNIKEVHLDLTHGINFMPVITYRALKEVLGVFNMYKKDQDQVKLFVYNSDPFVRGETPLVINTLENTAVSPSSYSFYIPSGEKIVFLKYVETEICTEKRRELEQQMREIIDQRQEKIFYIKDKFDLRDAINCFLGSIHNGIFMGVFYSYVPADTIMEIIEILENLWLRGIEVRTENNKLTIFRNIMITPRFAVLVMAWLNTMLLEISGVFKDLCEEGIELERIERIKDYLRRYEPFFTREFYKIEKNKDRITNDWQILGNIYEESQESPDAKKDKAEQDKAKQDKGAVTRNFLAHVGFLMNAVLIKKIKKGDNDKIILRYEWGDGLDLDIFKSACTKGMKEA
ncbi:MAG: CRISPR-associated CARF protein Csx1 [Candidatus Korarchaeota archaeon]